VATRAVLAAATLGGACLARIVQRHGRTAVWRCAASPRRPEVVETGRVSTAARGTQEGMQRGRA
jgi:hypothetical protein